MLIGATVIAKLGSEMKFVTTINPVTVTAVTWSLLHYCDVIMGAMVSQITGFTIVYSTVYSGADQRKHQEAPRHWPLCGEFAGDR